jgi:hypothetical protein
VVPSGLANFLAAIALVVAVVTSVLSGVLTSLVLKLPVRGIWVDALLGLGGFLFVLLAFVFWSPLQVFIQADESLPAKAALTASAAFPFIREFSRFIRLRRQNHFLSPD